MASPRFVLEDEPTPTPTPTRTAQPQVQSRFVLEEETPPPSGGNRVLEAVDRVALKLEGPTRAARKVVGSGIHGVLRGLRATQQALVTGPALEYAKTRKPLSIASSVRAGIEGVRKDVSFKDVAESYGLRGTRAVVAGLVGDIALDPLWIVTPAKVANALRIPGAIRGIARSSVGRAITESRAAQAVGRATVYRFGQPAEYAARAEQHAEEVLRTVNAATEIGKKIASLPVPEQRAIRTYMTAGTDARRAAVVRGAATRGMNAEAIAEVGGEAMRRDIALGRGLVDTGLMSEEAFAKWRGKHMRREYIARENPVRHLEQVAARNPEAAARAEQGLKQAAGFVGETRPLRERLQFLRQRKDIPFEVRKEMGEILEAAHPVAKGQALAGQSVATRRFFNDVSEKFGSDTLKPGYKFVGETPNLGPLAGKFLPEAIADDITRVINRPGEAERLFKRGVGWWKYGKVVLNPATHARNIMSNLMLADVAGVQPYKVHRYAQAIRSLVKRDEHFQEAWNAGTFLLDTWAGRELPKMLDQVGNPNRLRRVIGAITKSPSDAYEFEEQMFKMAVYIDKRKAGVDAVKAAALAEEAMFNYRKVPQFIDTLRTTGIAPFITFPYKALPVTAKAIYSKPATVGKYGDIMRTFEAPGSGKEKDLLPDHMRQGWMQLPGRDEAGRLRYVNANYIVPFSDLADIAGVGGGAGKRPVPISSPYLDLAGAMVTGVNPFTGRKIEDSYGGWRVYLGDFFLPSLLGGYGSREILAAVRKRPIDPLSPQEPKSLKEALAANVLGLRTRAVDFEEERKYRVREKAEEIEDIRRDLKRVMKSKWITEEEKQRELAEVVTRMRELAKEIMRVQMIPSP